MIDSSSQDDTAEYAKELGADVLIVPAKEFNHGSTRELARRHLKTDIVVMVTQDCYLENSRVLEILVAPLIEMKSSVAYARQRPHIGAGVLESFLRDFNYPAESHIRSLADLKQYGSYSFFCSNSCAAYLNKALDEIGGFEHVLLGEDTVAVAKLLHKGHSIAYVAEAVARHSHTYTLREEFKRAYDTGKARRGYHHLLATGGLDTVRGKAYALALTKKLFRECPQLLPYAALQTTVKWLGYKLGWNAENS